MSRTATPTPLAGSARSAGAGACTMCHPNALAVMHARAECPPWPSVLGPALNLARAPSLVPLML
eukprot:scaffold279276_cov39-Tisochrysis_lutea.AAC.2